MYGARTNPDGGGSMIVYGAEPSRGLHAGNWATGEHCKPYYRTWAVGLVARKR